MLKNILLILISILLFSFCSPQAKNDNKIIEDKNVTKPKSIKKIEPKKTETKKKEIKLSNSNVKEFLTEYGRNNPETLVLIKTSLGDIKIRLYKNTPLHRANFIMLVKKKFYDETVFYRVVKGFMIQGGDSDADDRKTKKAQIGNYSIPSEFNSELFHKKGAISMAREYDNNPNKRSSSFDFFIVQGSIFSEIDLKAIEIEKNIKFTDEQRKIYKTTGGAAHLDREHTVFGEVIEGIDIIDKIANVEIDKSSWPIDDIIMTIEVLK
ncbi:MAG: peptidylprolyl isomerase [Bacteroidales bacterium]|nr:peptidylprolyl isomerase [Bacteroidales bacterium]